MALDVGDKRIGVAVSDPSRMLVTPLVTVNRKNMATDVQRIASLAKEQNASEIVVGLPKNMDDSEGAQAAKVRSFAKKLAWESRLPIHFEDERLSTFSAIEMLVEQGVKTGHRRDLVDMEAAVIILQSYLDKLS